MLSLRSATPLEVAHYFDWCLESIRTEVGNAFSQLRWLDSDLGECARAFSQELDAGASYGFFRSLLGRFLLTRHGDTAIESFAPTRDEELVLSRFGDFAAAAINRRTTEPLDWDKARADTRLAKKAMSQVRNALLGRGRRVLGPREGLLQSLVAVGPFQVRSCVQISAGAILCWHDLESEDRPRILFRDSHLARLGIAEQCDIRGLSQKTPDEVVAFILCDVDRFVAFAAEQLLYKRPSSTPSRAKP